MKIKTFCLDPLNKKIFKVKKIRWNCTLDWREEYKFSIFIEKNRFDSVQSAYETRECWKVSFKNEADVFHRILNTFRESRRGSNEEKA